MVGRALIAAAAAVAVASAAHAVTPHGSWRPLDELAVPTTAALASAPAVRGRASAWGDPATGCFGLEQEIVAPGPISDPAGAIADVHASLRAALVRDGATVHTWQADRNESTATLTAHGLPGETRVRATLEASGDLRVVSALCFYAPRDAERSRERCRRFLDTL